MVKALTAVGLALVVISLVTAALNPALDDD